MSNRGLKNTPLNSACHIHHCAARTQEHGCRYWRRRQRKEKEILKKQFFLVEVGEKSGTNRRNITNWESWLRKRLKKGESVRKVKPCASVCDPSMPRSHHVCDLQQPICMFVCLISFVCSLQFSPISIYKIWKSKMKCIEGKPVHSVCLEIISESNWDLFFFLTDLSFWFSFHLFFFCLTQALKSCCHYSLLSFQGFFPLQNTFRSII